MLYVIFISILLYYNHVSFVILKALKPTIKPFVHLLCGQVLVSRAQAYFFISTTDLCNLCCVWTFRDIALLVSGITCPVRLFVLLTHCFFSSRSLLSCAASMSHFVRLSVTESMYCIKSTGSRRRIDSRSPYILRVPGFFVFT